MTERSSSTSQIWLGVAAGSLATAALAALAHRWQTRAARASIEARARQDYLDNHGHVHRPEGSAQEIQQEERAKRRSRKKAKE